MSIYLSLPSLIFCQPLLYSVHSFNFSRSVILYGPGDQYIPYPHLLPNACLPNMLTIATLLAALAASVSAATTSRTFAVNHFYGQGALVEGRMDPIVDPGGPAAHVHTIQGGSNFALTLSDTALLDSTCTSSLIKNDKSVYWTPKVYFQDPTNGSFIAVPLYYMNVYYFFEATDDDIVAFQPGHRMVIGDKTLRTPPASGGQSITVAGTSAGAPQPVQFTCPRQNYNEPSYPAGSNGLSAGIEDPNNQGAGVGFPDVNCDGTYSPLRADIHFPSCYNPAAGLDDYENNMAWPTASGTKQNCPEGWVHTPHIFYEVYWNTPLFADMWTGGQGTQPFVLSNGDNTGYSLHADFIAGWDVPTLQQIIDNCDAGDSGMDQCPGLIGGVNSASTTCNIPDAISEDIGGVLDALPGNNPVTGWGVSGSAPAESSSASSAASASSTSIASSSSSAASSSATASSATSAAGGGYGYSSSAASSSATPTTLAVSTVSAASSVGLVISTTSTPASSAAPYSYSAPVSSSSVAATVSASSASSASAPAYSTLASSASSPTASSTSTATNPTIPGWSYTACYSDQLNPRAIGTGGILYAYLGQHNVTTATCVELCDSKGFTIAGTEYGGQCFCDNSIQSFSKKLTQSACDIPCEGEDGAGQLCGGDWALSVYTKSSGVSARGHKHFGRMGAHKRSVLGW